MKQELTISLIKRSRKSSQQLIKQPRTETRKHSFRIPAHSKLMPEEKHPLLGVPNNDLEWEKSDYQEMIEAVPKEVPIYKPKMSKMSQSKEWLESDQKNEKTLNDKVFNLKPTIQKRLYIFNFLMNGITRICFLCLLVFLGIKNKWIYLQIFLSLGLTTLIMYFIIMIKMLFTRSDKQSVYFQKIFNQVEWADIQSQRLMRTHFNLTRILSKIKVFFNPRTKFQKSTKISFLRQEIFKRIELVMVQIPFSVMFFINQSDFVTDDWPNFNKYLTGAICLEVLRTSFTYLAIYIFN